MSRSLAHCRAVPRTWCALQTRSRSCLLRKSVTVSLPKVYETPRSLSPQPCSQTGLRARADCLEHSAAP